MEAKDVVASVKIGRVRQDDRVSVMPIQQSSKEISLAPRKRSKSPPSKALRTARRAAGITSDRGEITPRDYLLRLMNDETLSRTEQQAIAVKIAPCFHPKLKRLLPEQVPYDYPFIVNDRTDDLDAASDAQQRERIRKNLFERFD
jgi:hypothetical protein